MWPASRSPHSATITTTSTPRADAPVTSSDTTATTTKPRPQVTSITACLPARRATANVTAITTTIASAVHPRETAKAPRSTEPMSVVPDPGHPAASVGARLHRQDLVDAHAALLEGQRPADEVEPPHARHLLADHRHDPVPVRLERGVPRVDGADVVLAQRVHVAHLEPGLLDEGDRLPHGPHVHV